MLNRNSSQRLLSYYVAFVFFLAASQGTAATRVWDTMSPSPDEEILADRSGWRTVPTEAEKWSGPDYYNPEYYGMRYSFTGDAAVENEHLIAVFSSREGKAIVFSKADQVAEKVEVVPLEFRTEAARITRLDVLQNTGDEAALGVVFSAAETGKNLSVIFSFGKKRIVEIRPAENVNGISLISPIRYGVVPDFIGDDLILDPQAYPSLKALHIPSANVFVGLLEGRNDMLTVTWPTGKQRVRLVPDTTPGEPRLIGTVDIENDGKCVFLAVLSAPGIWHEEVLKASYLERDVASTWKRPFPAKWTTQLLEDRVKTTFTFREVRPEKFWRGGVGFYPYPVWFEDGTTFYRLGKKIPPGGKSLVYCLERKGTPASVLTPVDILKDTLGGEVSGDLLDVEGRRLRSHRRKDAVIGAATCEVTDGMQPVFEAGEEVERKEYIHGGVDDMVYFVTRQRQRIDEYQDFAGRIMDYLDQTARARPELKAFIADMRAVTQKIVRLLERQKENMKTLAYADEIRSLCKQCLRNPDGYEIWPDY